MNALAENKTVLAHNDFFEILRNVEYKRLDTHKQVYLDFTGGNLYAKSQILEHQDLLINNILGNPHSTNPTSQLSTKLVEKTFLDRKWLALGERGIVKPEDAKKIVEMAY